MKKRLLAMLLCIAMVLSVMPVAAFATEAEETPQVLAAEETVEIVEETTEAVEETEAAEETVAEEPVEAEPEATEAAEEAAEETVPQETEVVTEEVIEVPGDEEAVKNSVTYDEENNMYWFETFEDLQQLAAQWPADQWMSVRYKGTDDFVVTADLTLPNGMGVQVHGCTMIIPEGVVYDSIGGLQVDALTVNGKLVNQNNLYVDKKLEINGDLDNVGIVSLSATAELVGKDKIAFTSDWAAVQRNVNCQSKEELLAALATQGSEGANWVLVIYLMLSENMVLDQDVYIAENTYVSVYASDYTITVPAGCTFHVDSRGFDFASDLIIEGTLKHEKGMINMDASGASITFTGEGKYEGAGEIGISDWGGVGHFDNVFKGLDLSEFKVEDYGNYWYIKYVGDLQRLAAPTDLTWHKSVEWGANDTRTLVDLMGAVAFKPAEPNQGDYEVTYWMEQNGEYVRIGSGIVGYSLDYEQMPEWLADDFLVRNGAESGNYKFSVKAITWGEEGYADSEEVFSDVFTYVKPTAKLKTPTVKGIVENDRGGFDATWGNTSANDNIMIQWYWVPNANTEITEENCAWTNWGRFGSSVSADEYFLQEYSNGYYAFKVRVLSDDITKTCPSDWSALSEVYYHYDAAGVARIALQDAIMKFYENPAFDVREAIQAIDNEAMLKAIKEDRYGMFLDYMREAEAIVAGGPAGVVVADGFTAMSADQISVIGANLNDGANISLVVGKAAKSHTLAADYKHSAALSFSMKLENVAKQEVPVVVTLPVPAGITPSSAVVVHHAAGGDEYLKPISYDQNAITIAVTDFSDFTITQRAFNQAAFEEEIKAAMARGDYGYELTQPVKLTKNMTLTGGFQINIGDGGSLTIPKGVTFKTDGYVLVNGTGAEVIVNGTMNVGFAEVVQGTMTIAKGAKLKTEYDYVGLFVNGDAALTGWDKSKIHAMVNVSSLEEIEKYIAQVKQYYYMTIYVVGEKPVVIDKNLTIPQGVCLMPNYGAMTLKSGNTLSIGGELSVSWGGVLNVEQDAVVKNNGYVSLYGGTLNLDGSYSGIGNFELGPECQINGDLIRVSYEERSDNTMALFANVLPEDPNAEYVWEILEGDEYCKLDVNGDTAIASDKVEITEEHDVIIKVSTKDGRASNTFRILAIPNEEVDPDHKHKYETELERVEPTHTEEGYVIYGCECGETKKETIKALGLGKPVVTAVNYENGYPFLYWEHEGIADSYKVSRATSKSGTYKVIDTVTEGFYMDTTATAGKTYYYKIEAVCAANSKLNSKSDVVTAYAKCGQPVVTAEINKITGKPVFTWEKVAGASKYEIYRDSFELAGTTTKLTFEDKDAEVGKTYSYTVRAVASKNNYSGVESAAVEVTAICAQPVVSLTLNKENGMPLLTWEAVDGAALYRVLSVNEAGEITPICEQKELSYQEGNVGPGVLCTYLVEAIDENEQFTSFAAGPVSIYSAIGTPVMTAENDVKSGKPKLTWTNVEGATSYKVYRSTKATKSYKEIAEVETLEYLDESVAVGKTFYYKVLAVVGETTSEFSNYEKLSGQCAQPEIKVVSNAKTGKPTVSWEKVSGAKKYEVYRANAIDGEYKKITTTTKTSYADSKAVVGTECYYKVKAIGSKSAYNSAESEISMDKVICAQPVVKTALDAATGKPSLSWKAVAGAESYWIGRKLPGEAEATEIAVVTDLQFVDLEAPIDTEVQYSIAALSEVAGSESWPAWVTVRSAIASPSVAFTVDEATGKPVVGWGAVEGAVAYKVYRSSKATKSYKVVATVEALEYMDTSVAAGKGYYYKVMAVGENCASAYSAYARIYANCAQPVVEATSNDKEQPVLSWAKVAGAKKYQIYRSTAIDGTYKSLGTTTKTTYTDKKVEEGMTYYYTVKAIPSSSKYASVLSVPVEFAQKNKGGANGIPAAVKLQDTQVLKGKKIGASIVYTGDEWCAEVAKAMETIAAYYGAVLDCQDGQLSAEMQWVQIDNMLANGCDYLMIDPVWPDAVNGALDNAVELGVPITIFDGIWDQGAEKAETTVTWAQKETGTKMGEYFVEYVKKNMGGKATVLELTNVVSAQCQLRYEGFHEVIAKANQEGCQITILDCLDSQGNSDVAYQAVAGITEPYDVVVSDVDYPTNGVLKYLREVKNTDVKVLSMGAYGKVPFGMLKDKDPNYLACVNVDPWILAQYTIESAIHYFNGEENPTTTNIPLYVVDSSNVADFMVN